MATLRLNNTIRGELYQYAKSLIAFPEDDKAAEDAYQLAEKLAREAIVAAIPDADMVVLVKYDMMENLDRFHFHLNGIDRWFTFRWDHIGTRDENSANLPKWFIYYTRKAVMGNKELFAAIENAEHTRNQREKHRQQLESDYQHMINSSRTFEELAELWPEAEVMREKYEVRVVKNAVSCLSTEALQRIKDDVAARSQKGE